MHAFDVFAHRAVHGFSVTNITRRTVRGISVQASITACWSVSMSSRDIAELMGTGSDGFSVFESAVAVVNKHIKATTEIVGLSIP